VPNRHFAIPAAPIFTGVTEGAVSGRLERKELPSVTITLELAPDVERGLLAQAQAKGITVNEYVREIVTREASSVEGASGTGEELLDIAAPVRGLLTDEEIDTLFARNRSASRSIDLG